MDRIEQIILHFLQKKANADELNELNDWLKHPENKKGIIREIKIWLWSGQVKDKSPKVEFAETWERIENKQPLIKRKTLHFNRFLRYAALFLVLLNIGWWGARFYYGQSVASEEQIFQVAANQLSNSVVTLPDQTLVYLRNGSNLQYNSGFNKGHREVLLDGEAYFEVARDENTPFLVKTERAKIKVLGTKFNVLAEKGATYYQTTLVEGKVEFETGNGEKYMLQPDQMIEFHTKKYTAQIKQVNTELYTAWKDGKIIFRDETLGEITNKLERIYHVKFIYKKPELANKYNFSGTFHPETSIGEVITMLKISIPMKVQRTERFPEPDLIYLE